MVFHCRCFSFSLEENEDNEIDTSSFEEDHVTEIDAITQAKSTSNDTFYTASSDFNRPAISNLNENPNKLRVFTLAELKAATNNFSRGLKIGEDKFGSIYRGVIKSLQHLHEIQVTVKYGASQRLKEWVTAVNFLEVVEHPNIVKLVGYCGEFGEIGTQRFLVYEYMPNRSVRDHLSRASLSWIMRLKVARDVACALAYLHKDIELQNNLEDFKSSNILLDDQWNAKLSDLGLVRLGPQGRLARTCNQFGYTAQRIQSGYLTSKSDVWSYGVLLCELITGRRPLDKSRPKIEQNLLEWVKPYLDSQKFHLIVDSRLEGKYSLESLQKLSIIANMCLFRNHESRPVMSEILEMLNQIITVPLQETKPDTPLKHTLVRSIAIKLKKLFMCTTKL